MTAGPLESLRADVGRRRALIALLVGTPIVLAIGLLAQQFAPDAARAIQLVAVFALFAMAYRAFRRVTPQLVARRLDARRFDFEDSGDLLLRDGEGLNPLEHLQRERLLGRMARVDAATLRDPWPWRAIAGVWLAAVALIAIAWFVPLRGTSTRTTPDAINAAQPERAPTETRITARTATITPPAYTGLAAREVTEPAMRVEAGANVAWRFTFDPPPTRASLVFHDRSLLALEPRDGAFVAARTIDAATLYRVEVEGPPLPSSDQALHRIDVVPDRAPEIRVIAPERTLTLLEAGQRNWALSFEANDDYGLGAAELSITLAQGSGENIEVSERTVSLAGEGGDRAKQYRRTLDLAQLGIAEGDDVIVRLTVRDRRAPTPNVTKTASFILRWPPEPSAESTGVEGLVRDTLPAYFRSQRQIIIDTEALVAARSTMGADEFTSKSDLIGVDQQILRLRYGQFLGEEASEIGGGHGDEHDEPGGDPDAKPGTDVLAEFGHLHNESEAATLMDPETKAILRRALSAMWDAELELRSGRPNAALPHEHRALDAIKEVQQASRIYLARVGLELPPVDATRRLTGDLATARGGASALDAVERDPAVDAAWRALSRGETVALEPVDAWLATQDAADERVLPVVAALDRVRREPDCAACRAELAGRIWALIDAPRPSVQARRDVDAAGRAYLDALAAPAETP